jgi:cobalt-precorrin-6B (C15)-methyltransferase
MKPKGGPTKEEIIAILLSKLQIKKDDLFTDIGCGTGSVSLEAAKLAEKVYAIDRSEEAINFTKERIKEEGFKNIETIQGEAKDVIPKLPDINCAFIGGTREVTDVVRRLSEKVHGRIVVNAARIEIASNVINTMKELGIFKETLLINISKGYDLAGGTAFKPLNPIFMVVGECL